VQKYKQRTSTDAFPHGCSKQNEHKLGPLLYADCWTMYASISIAMYLLIFDYDKKKSKHFLKSNHRKSA